MRHLSTYIIEVKGISVLGTRLDYGLDEIQNLTCLHDACVYCCRMDYIYQVLNLYLVDLSYNTH